MLSSYVFIFRLLTFTVALIDASKQLFEQLNSKIMNAVEDPLSNLNIGLNIDKITQPCELDVHENLITFDSIVY